MSNKEWIQPWSKTSKNLTIDGWFGSKAKFNPGMLNPYAWYDANLGGSATQIADSSANARAAITNGAGSNAALFLPYTAPSVYLPGAAGNSVSCPSSGSLNVAGDVEIVVRVALSSWTPAARSVIASKWTTTGNISWSLNIASTGNFEWWVDIGGTTAFLSFTAPGGLSAGTQIWIRATRASASGTAAVYWAADSETEPTSWTSVGSGSSTVGALSSSTSPIRLGDNSNLASPADCRIFRFIMRSALSGGTTIADFNPASSTQTGYTDPSGNVWTVNRATSGRKTVVQSPAANSAESLFLYGPDDFQTVPNAAIPSFGTSGVGSIYTVVRTWGSGTNYLFGNLTGGVGPGMQAAHLGGSSLLYFAASDGTNTSAQSMAWPTAGKRAVIGVHFTATQMYISVNGVNGAPVSRPPGSINSSAGFVLGGYVGTVGSGDHEGRTLLTLDSAPSANVGAQLTAYYGGGL